jgi:hypothetical protein
MQNPYFLLALLAMFISTASSAQLDTTLIHQTHVYVALVDSLDDQTHDASGKVRSRLHLSIAEGPITTTTTQITFNKAKGKNDTLFIQKELGGLEIYTLSSQNDDTLFKVNYHDNSTKNLYQLFYYKGDTLLYAEIRLEDDGAGAVLFKGMEYYKGGKLYCRVISDDSLDKNLRYRVSFSWKEKGEEYLRKFKAR